MVPIFIGRGAPFYARAHVAPSRSHSYAIASAKPRVHAAAVSIERRITFSTSVFDRNKSWLMMPQPESEASITRTPIRSRGAFSAAPTRVIPPAIRPDSANQVTSQPVICCPMSALVSCPPS